MNEIEIKKYELPKLEIKDYDVILKQVEEDNLKYKNYIVTEDTLQVDIKKRTELRKQAKTINDRRIAIEKEISEPIKEFKMKCDVLKNMYEESSSLIDKQIKVFEEKEKEDRKKLARIIFDNMIGELKDIVKFESVFDEKWLNKGSWDSDGNSKLIESDIKNIKEKIENGLEAIRNLESEFETELINTFLEDFDITKAIFKNTQLKEKKEAMQKVEKQQEVVKEEKVEKMLTTKIQTEEIDPIKTYTLTITAELSKQKKLKEFLELNEMQFRRVD